MPYEKLLELLERFANVVPGGDSKALDYIFTAGEIDSLYSQYLDAKASSNEELMTEISEMISFKAEKYL